MAANQAVPVQARIVRGPLKLGASPCNAREHRLRKQIRVGIDTTLPLTREPTFRPLLLALCLAIMPVRMCTPCGTLLWPQKDRREEVQFAPSRVGSFAYARPQCCLLDLELCGGDIVGLTWQKREDLLAGSQAHWTYLHDGRGNQSRERVRFQVLQKIA